MAEAGATSTDPGLERLACPGVHGQIPTIDRQKDALLDEISRRMEQQTTQEELFSLRWRLI